MDNQDSDVTAKGVIMLTLIGIIIMWVLYAQLFGCSIHLMGKYYECDPQKNEPGIVIEIPDKEKKDVEDD